MGGEYDQITVCGPQINKKNSLKMDAELTYIANIF